MTRIEVYSPVQAEWSAAYPIIKGLYCGYFNNELSELEYARELEKAHEDPGFILLFAKTTGVVNGVLAARISHYVFIGQAAWIHSLAVTPEARRQGIGRALIGRLKEIAHERRLKAIYFNAALSTLNPDYAGIGRFHERCGAQVIGQFFTIDLTKKAGA